MVALGLFYTLILVTQFSIFLSKRTVFAEPGNICKECPAESVMGENVMMPALVSSDILTEWKAFRKYIANEKKKEIC